MSDVPEKTDIVIQRSEFYFKIFNELPQGVVVIRNNEIIYTNLAMSKLIGMPINRLLGWTVEDLLKLLLDEDRKLAEAVYAIGKAGSPSKDIQRFRYIHRTKGIRYVEIIPNVVEFEKEIDYVGIISDVTDSVDAMEDLRKSRDQLTLYREIFERSNDAIAIIDSEGQYIEQNDFHKQLFGYSDSYLRGRTPAAHLGEEVFRNMFNDLKMSGTFRGELRSKTRTGKEIIQDISAFSIRDEKDDVVCYISITRDITEKAMSDEYLRKSEREKSAILDSMSDHVNYYDSKDMKIVWTNSAAAQSLDLTPEDIVGQYCYQLWHGVEKPCDKCPVVLAQKTGLAEENEIHTPDGRIWYIKGFPVKDEQGNVSGVVEVTREITAQKQASEETREARARAELFNDLMAHDLNNINQGIMASLELTLLQEDIPLPIKEPLEAALEQVKRGVTLISNVRRFSKIDREPSDLTPLDIYPALVGAAEMVKNSYPKKIIDLKIHVSREQYTVLADEFLTDAFYNILHNSAKHDGKENIRIEISAILDKKAEYLDIIFDDFGPGIQDKLKKRILSRLSEGRKQGSGLGLTLVQRIAERYGAQVMVNDRIEGNPERGTRVVIRIPAVIEK